MRNDQGGVFLMYSRGEVFYKFLTKLPRAAESPEFPKACLFSFSFNSAKSFWLKLARVDFCGLKLKNRLNRVKSQIINNQSRLGSQQF